MLLAVVCWPQCSWTTWMTVWVRPEQMAVVWQKPALVTRWGAWCQGAIGISLLFSDEQGLSGWGVAVPLLASTQVG